MCNELIKVKLTNDHAYNFGVILVGRQRLRRYGLNDAASKVRRSPKKILENYVHFEAL